MNGSANYRLMDVVSATLFADTFAFFYMFQYIFMNIYTFFTHIVILFSISYCLLGVGYFSSINE